MLVPLGRRGVAVFALGAVSVGLASYAVTAMGATPEAPASTCRASLARITLAGQVLAEPFIANDAGAPCTAENADVIGDFDLDPLPVSGRLLYTRTNAGDPQAESGVADLTIALGELIPGAPTLGVQVLTSEAGVACNNGTASSSGHSRVVGLSVDGEDQLVIPPDDAFTEIPIDPLINVKLNEQTRDGNTVTQRALHINALAGNLDIVVAEAIAGFTGNPCGTVVTDPPPPPPPSDVVGWMTGGGQLQADETHNLTLPCTTTQKHPKPQLKVTTPGGTFSLTQLSAVSCTNDASQGSSDDAQRAGFNTLTGNGTGSCGKGPGNVPIRFTFTDEGEANQGVDEAHITITGSPCAFQGEGTVNGNQQAHRGTNPPA
jgi:hypothetical protein